jgi:DNA-binding IclR family transcriptional regulator
VADRAALSAAKQANYTAERVLRALEVIVFAPSSAPAVADAIGVHARTVRRILRTLSQQQYVERRAGRGRTATTYVPTVRLLAMAAQLAPRLPLVEHGRRATRELHHATGLTGYLAIPSYGEILVIARAGEHSPRLWALLPATEDAAGRLLLAHRDAWRHSLGITSGAVTGDDDVRVLRERGYASITREGERIGSLAVAVPAQDGPPLAALAIQGPSSVLITRETTLAELLHHTAAQLARRSARIE